MAREIVKAKSRGFICVSAHPEGCRKNIEDEKKVMRPDLTSLLSGPKSVLVVGASTGYGLASRAAAAWGFGAKTLGVFLERPPERGRTATAGYYNTVAFHDLARKEGLFAASINADAFSAEAKKRAAEIIRHEMGKLDLLIYSVAAPKRTESRTGEVYSSVLKPVGQAFTNRTIELDSARVTDVTIQPATEKEIEDTIAVMGGHDWNAWVHMLLGDGLLSEGARTLAYSYIGPRLTWPVYRDGTIGEAKKHLEATSRTLSELLQGRLGGAAYVAVNKAIVTQASAAIPVVPLYVSILRKVMREEGLEEGAIEQMKRLFTQYLAEGKAPKTDECGRIRMDDREMSPGIQQRVAEIWPTVTTENLNSTTDFAGFKRAFLNLFGFEVAGVDYSQPVEIDLALT